MAILRTDISRALDELINNEAGTLFQALAVVVAKQKWPDLIASEWHNDGGLDAYAPASLAEGKKAKGNASSITGTLGKVKDDAKRAKENYRDLEVLIFVTPHKITVLTAKEWAEQVRKEFGLKLYIIAREDIVTSLMLPSNVSLCGTLPGIHVPLEHDGAKGGLIGTSNVTVRTSKRPPKFGGRFHSPAPRQEEARCPGQGLQGRPQGADSGRSRAAIRPTSSADRWSIAAAAAHA
jgi:hypothetical protein